MAKCKECGSEYTDGVKDFCSEECFKIDIQKRIDEATKREKSHTTKISVGDS